MVNILIEGPDRIGKTTLAKALRTFFEKQNLKTLILHPNQLIHLEKLNSLKFKDPIKLKDFNPITPSLSHDYLCWYTIVLKRHLELIKNSKPDIVIYDRSFASYLAYWCMRLSISKLKLPENELENSITVFIKNIHFLGIVDIMLTFNFHETDPSYDSYYSNYWSRFNVDKPFFDATYDTAMNKAIKYIPEILEKINYFMNIYEDFLIKLDKPYKRYKLKGYIDEKTSEDMITNIGLTALHTYIDKRNKKRRANKNGVF